MKPRNILIKKYENRRLYDTVNSRYVNLDEVARMLQKGDIVRVVDAISGEDITRLVLTQIIVEDAKAPDSHFPVEVLRQMVLASGQATREGATRYMQALLDVYENSFRVMGTPSPFGQHADPIARAGESKYSPSSNRSGTSRGVAAEDSIDELKRRVAELEAIVAKAAKKPGKR